MIKKFGVEQWISIEPNIIMATELLKLYISYTKENNEKYKLSLKNKKQILTNENFNVNKEIENEEKYEFVDKSEYERILKVRTLESKDVELLKLKEELQEITDKHYKLLEISRKQDNQIESLKNYNSQIIIESSQNTKFFREQLNKKEEEFFEKQKNKIHKKYKLFGITIFTVIQSNN
jgi:hypothetical protein